LTTESRIGRSEPEAAQGAGLQLLGDGLRRTKFSINTAAHGSARLDVQFCTSSYRDLQTVALAAENGLIRAENCRVMAHKLSHQRLLLSHFEPKTVLMRQFSGRFLS